MLIKYCCIQFLLYLSFFQYVLSENATLDTLENLINSRFATIVEKLETNKQELADKLNALTDKIDLSCKEKTIDKIVDRLNIDNKIITAEFIVKNLQITAEAKKNNIIEVRNNNITDDVKIINAKIYFNINNATDATKLNNVTNAVNINNATDAEKINNETNAVNINNTKDAEKINNETNAMNVNNIKNAEKINNLTGTVNINATESELYKPICTRTFKELSNVKIDIRHTEVVSTTEADIDDDYYNEELPVEDDLDRFMVNKTGCTYKNLTQWESFNALTVNFDGTLLEWKVALRTGNTTAIWVIIGGEGKSWNGYGFYIGQHENKATQLRRKGWGKKVNWEEPVIATPGILSADRYIPFYFRIQPGVISFGRECEEPLLVYKGIVIDQGAEVIIVCEPLSNTKYLYNCPNDSGQSSENTDQQ